VAFPRAAITARLHANVDTLVRDLGGGKAARKLFLAEIDSKGLSGHSSPFLKTLFPEVKLAATIERSLNTALGRGWDHMAADIARAAHGDAETNHTVRGTIPGVTATHIDSIVAAYTGGNKPDTAKELASLLPTLGAPGAKEAVLEKDDVYFVSSSGTENHIEIKTPKPNYDQGRASKRRILRVITARHPQPVEAFVGMPYNPNGLLGDYTWPVTKYVLDMGVDLRIGRDFWNHVGNSPDAYEELLDCFLEVSVARKPDLLDLLREV
jgi:hypothetical protein